MTAIDRSSRAFYTISRIPSTPMMSYLTPCETAYFKRTSLTIWTAFLYSELHLTGKAARQNGFKKVTAVFAKMIQMGRCPKERFTALKISPGRMFNVLIPFTADSMQHIVQLPLTRLEFEKSAIVQVDEGCFQHFAAIPSLNTLLLPLTGKCYKNTTLRHLTGLKLQHLRISNLDLEDEDFALFTPMPLEKLELFNISVKQRITSLCLDHLEKLPLKELTIKPAEKQIEYHCADAPVRKIASLKKINEQDIRPLPSAIIGDIGSFKKTGKAIDEHFLTFLSIQDGLSFRKTCKSFRSLALRGQTCICTNPSNPFAPCISYPFALRKKLENALKSNILYEAILLNNPVFGIDLIASAYSETMDRAFDLFRYFPLKFLEIGHHVLNGSPKGYQKLVKASNLEKLSLSYDFDKPAGLCTISCLPR